MVEGFLVQKGKQPLPPRTSLSKEVLMILRCHWDPHPNSPGYVLFLRGEVVEVEHLRNAVRVGKRVVQQNMEC